MMLLQPRRTRDRDSDWRDVSERLDQFFDGDFRYIKAEIRRIYRKSWKARIVRDVTFVEAFCRELMPHYNVLPSRIFAGTPDAGAEMRRAYSAFGIDAAIASAAVRLAAQQTLVCVWIPVWSTDPYGWSIHTLSPWQTEIHPAADDPTNIQRARAVKVELPRITRFESVTYDIAEFVRVPDPGDNLAGIPLCETARRMALAGRSAAVWSSDGTPVYTTTSELPLGMYPIAVGRIGEARGGDFYAPLPRWLHDAQVAMGLADSDMEFRGRYSGGQLVIYGHQQDVVEKIPFGPDKVVGIVHGPDGNPAKLENVARQVDAPALISLLDSYVSRLRQYAGLRPESYSGHAVTADAKLIEGWVQQMLRADIQKSLVDFEQSMLRAATIAIGWRFGAGTAPVDCRSVTVRYVLQKPPRNDAQMAQAYQMRAEMGLEDVGQTVADEAAERGEDISRAMGLERATRNRIDFEGVRNAAAGA